MEFELGERLFGGGEGEEFFGGVAGAQEENFGLVGIESEGNLLAGLVGDGGHGGLEAGGGGAGPGDGLDAGDGDEADGSEFAEGFPADVPRLNVGREWAGPAFGRAGEHDDNFAFELQTFEIVVLHFGHAEAVADEDHGRFHGGGGVGPQAEIGLFTEFNGERLALANEGEAGVGFVDLAGLELHGLRVALGAGGGEAEAFELFGDVGGGLAVALATGVAAFEFVVGEELDVLPPKLAVVVGGERSYK